MILQNSQRFFCSRARRLDSWVEQLRRCKTLEEGREIHVAIAAVKTGNSDVFLSNLLIQMYSRCGSLGDATAVFDSIQCPNSFSWTILISSLAHHGHLAQALQRYRLMLHSGAVADEVTIVTVLDACDDLRTGNAIVGSVMGEHRIIAHTKVRNAAFTMYGRCGDISMARLIFEEIPAKDDISWNSIITAYARSGHLEEAEVIFTSMPLDLKNVVSWTAVIAGNAQHGRSDQAFRLFRTMILAGDPDSRPNEVTLLAVLDACVGMTSPSKANAALRRIEAMAAESTFHADVMVNSAIVNAYGIHDNIPDARRIFESMPVRNVVSWSSMVAALARSQRCDEAMEMLREMELEGIKASSVTLLAAIEACQSSKDAGRFHDRIVRDGFGGDTKLGNALVGLYGLKLEMIDQAKEVFDQIQHKNAVSWGVLIDACTSSGSPEEALLCFKLMDLEGVRPEEISFTLAIDACAALPSLQQGRMIHREMIQTGCRNDLHVSNSLINMYAKCSSIPDAREVFDSMPDNRDVISWTAMLAAYAQNGSHQAAWDFFQAMKLEGIHPNGITLINLLAACSHVGMLEQCRDAFLSMISDFSFQASGDHYLCMVDLLARCGRLTEAESLIEEMPYEPDPVAWTTLLGGSRTHGDCSRARGAAKSAWKHAAQARHPASYTLLSHVYEEG